MHGEVAVDCYDSLDGQVALVTGATRGVGAAIASALADLGATVDAGARDTGDVTASKQRAFRLDVTAESEIGAALDRIDDDGRLDSLANNAGVFHRSGPLHEMSTDEFEHTVDVNLRGPALVATHALPLVLAQEGGRVVSLSSDLGQFSTGQMGGNYPPYRVSKAGLGGLTAYLHAEYGDE